MMKGVWKINVEILFAKIMKFSGSYEALNEHMIQTSWSTFIHRTDSIIPGLAATVDGKYLQVQKGIMQIHGQ